MKPHDVLKDAGALIGERGQDYGGIEDNFKNIADIANAMTGLQLTPYHVAMIMCAVKFARIKSSPYKDDNYLDGINYLAFAHELRPTHPGNKWSDLPITDDEMEEIINLTGRVQ